MTIEALRDLVDARVFVYATGAGAGIQKKLWEVPGCSSFLIGCGFPYASELTSKYIGFTPDKFVCTNTAMELAMSAYLLAYEAGRKTIGVGISASVASTIAHRGDHKIVAATFSDSKCFVFSTNLKKDVGIKQRILDGDLTDTIGISLILKEAFELNNNDMFKLMIRPGEQIALNDQMLSYSAIDTTDYAKTLILTHPFYHMNGSRLSEKAIDVSKVIFYPGSFNKFHFGHEMGAEAIRQTAAKKLGECRDIIFTTVINPSHKPALSASEMLNRVADMKGRNFCLTADDPLFIDKAERHPGGWFCMGSDTLLRMLDPIWGYSISDLLNKFSELNTKMFVMGRLIKNDFICLEDIKKIHPIINKYDHLFVDVPGRWDISSTELRIKK